MKLKTIESMAVIIGTILNLYIAKKLYNLNKKENNPKISFIPEKIEINHEKNEGFIEPVFDYSSKEIDYNLTGFPEIEDSEKMWNLKIKNISEFPALGLYLKIKLVIKRVNPIFGIDYADLVDVTYDEYKSFEYVFERAYFPGMYELDVPMLKLNGQFIEAEVYIEEAYSREIKYIKSKILIDKYIHTKLWSIGDSIDDRKIHGFYDKIND